MILNCLQVRKVEEEGELPGLMIEEMMESASVVRVDRCGDDGCGDDREEMMDGEMVEEMGIDKTLDNLSTHSTKQLRVSQYAGG